MKNNLVLLPPEIHCTGIDSLPDPYTLFCRDHLARVNAWARLAAPGGMAQINLANNEAVYDRFIDPEISLLIGRHMNPFDITLLQVTEMMRIALVHPDFLFGMMEAVHG